MVYRGRPSTGCKKCRERKVKCDETTGGCRKCAARGYSCPGYDRTKFDFFQDETENVQSKAKVSKAKAIAARDARYAVHKSQSHSPTTVDQEVNPIGNSPGLQLMSTLIDQGVSFFMVHYATGVDQPSIHSSAYHKHLSTDGFHPLVATTMTALGIAGVSNIYGDPTLRKEAIRWYLNAIKMTNAALSSPNEVKTDSTLIAVNLLGMFEATFNDSSLAGWSNHVDGAASLVKLRGMEQFSTPAGQRMYLHTIGLLTMNCMGKGQPLPKFVRDMNKKISEYLDIKDPRNAFFFLHVKTIDLRAQILSEKTLGLEQIIAAALELDEIALRIFEDSDPDWTYQVILCEDRSDIFGCTYHVYATAAAAQTWNWVRYNRIYFHDIVRNSILAGFATTPPSLVGNQYHEQLTKSTAILYQVQSDIIASMPQFLHDVPMTTPPTPTPNNPLYQNRTFVANPGNTWSEAAIPDNAMSTWPTPPATPPSSGAIATVIPQGVKKALHQNFRGDSIPAVRRSVGDVSVSDRLPIVRVSGGYSTVWALYVAGSMPLASTATQDFVQACLSRIEWEFGISQAKVLANALRIKRVMDKAGAIPFGICPAYLPPDDLPWVQHQSGDSKITELPDVRDLYTADP